MVSYVPNARGQMLELCEQDGWSPTTAAVVDLSSDTILVKRTSCSASRGAAISAQTKDAMKIVSPNVIAATSLVNQYVNGAFVGQYRTQSVLHRAG